MPFAQTSFHEATSLTELLETKTDAWIYFRRFGRVSAKFGSHPPKLYKMPGGTLTSRGLLREDRFVEETTFFDIYREKGQFTHEVAALDPLRTRQYQSTQSVRSAIFCCHQWDDNYQHFLIEEFPRIWAAASFTELADLPIVVSDRPHIREIAEICFPDRQFIFLKQEDSVRVSDFVYYVGAVAFNFGDLPKVVGLALLDLRAKTRAKAGLPEETPATRQVFFSRRPHASYAGNSRTLVNYGECADLLSRMGFTTDDFDNRTLAEKAKVADGVSVAISPVGANLMNFIFLPLSASVVIIEHPNFKGNDFFTRLFVLLGFDKTRISALEVTRFVETELPRNNAPFAVDTAILENDLEEFLFVSGGKKLNKSIFLAGLSNGVFKEGYAKGLQEATSGKLDNISLGASNSGYALWLNGMFPQRVLQSDVAIFDFYITDYKTRLEYVQRDLPALLGALPNGCLSVVLLWPDQQGMADIHEPTVAAYREACQKAGALFIDCRTLFYRTQQLVKAPSVDALFKDSAHLRTDYARIVGKMIAAKISGFLRAPRQLRHIFVERLTDAAGFLVGPPWLRIPITPDKHFTANRPGHILGMMVHTRHHDFEIRVKDQRQRVFVYWAPEDPHPPEILRYIAIGSVPFAAGEIVEIATYADDEPVFGMEISSLLISYD